MPTVGCSWVAAWMDLYDGEEDLFEKDDGYVFLGGSLGGDLGGLFDWGGRQGTNRRRRPLLG